MGAVALLWLQDKPAIEHPEKFKQCAKCKAAWYCPRDCQVRAWHGSHKIDCIKLTEDWSELTPAAYAIALQIM